MTSTLKGRYSVFNKNKCTQELSIGNLNLTYTQLSKFNTAVNVNVIYTNSPMFNTIQNHE